MAYKITTHNNCPPRYVYSKRKKGEQQRNKPHGNKANLVNFVPSGSLHKQAFHVHTVLLQTNKQTNKHVNKQEQLSVMHGNTVQESNKIVTRKRARFVKVSFYLPSFARNTSNPLQEDCNPWNAKYLYYANMVVR